MVSLTRTVTSDDTALAVGSGDVEVLGTPVVVAWLEAATCAALDDDAGLVEGETSVGTEVAVRHLAPSVVGAVVTATAEVTDRSGRVVTFSVHATDGDTRVAEGTITRAVVDRARFLDRLPPRHDAV